MIIQLYNPSIPKTPEVAPVLTVLEPPEAAPLETMMAVIGAVLKVELLANMGLVKQVMVVAKVDERLRHGGIHIFPV
jgi:hypothetical protein